MGDLSSDNEQSSVTTSVMSPVDLVFDGWMIMEARQLWSDLRYRFGTDDRRSNISFGLPGFGSLLVAIPTVEDPPEAPREIDGLKVLPLDEFFHAVLVVHNTNEKIKDTIKLLNS